MQVECFRLHLVRAEYLLYCGKAPASSPTDVKDHNSLKSGYHYRDSRPVAGEEVEWGYALWSVPVYHCLSKPIA